VSFSIEGQTVVLFGASSGLGLATAKAARAAGAAVTIVARDPQRLDRARTEIGEGTRAESLDGADAAAVQALFETFDRVDHVASFTGEQPHASLADISHDLYQRAMDARVWAARNVCAGAAPRMPPTGSLTFCSGVSAFRPRANRSAGAAATAALESFARAMAVELAPIRVNSICPGSFDTPVLDRAFGENKDEVMRPYLAQLPLGRLGRPEELAHAVLFLMTATYVTGTVLHVDGGALLI
jgi:NAD(P)-dependent dehydrogenase (short-subunit alcohol dehydrogenase family)